MKIGEIIESDTNGFTARCYRLYEGPDLGCLVKAGTNNSVYGIVAHVATLGLDPSRRPITRGENLESEDEVYLRNPQLTRLLTTEIKAITVGFSDGMEFKHYLPASPPRLHSFVSICGNDEWVSFSDRLYFLKSVISSGLPQGDDIIGSFVRQTAELVSDPVSYKLKAARSIAKFLGGDTNRLESIVRRIR